MDLDLDSTQTLLRDTVREYLEAEVPFDRIRALEAERRWDEALWKGVCDQGWLGLPFPEEVGGGGGSLVDAGILVEEFARRAAVVPLVEVLACGLALQQAGADRAPGPVFQLAGKGDSSVFARGITPRPIPASGGRRTGAHRGASRARHARDALRGARLGR